MEKTLVILKPDAVKRKLIGEIITRFENKDLSIPHMKVATMSREQAVEHYGHVSDLPIFNDMIDYMTSGICIFMIIEGYNSISVVRNLIGSTNCFQALPGTIRGDFGLHKFQNLIHGSDSVESSNIEIKRFFEL